MAWGALMGLGQGLQSFGDSVYKSKLAEKLEKEREARAEQRQIAAEQRAAAAKAKEVAKTELVEVSPGKWEVVDFNSLGEVLNRRAANPTDIKAKELGITAQEVGIEAGRLGIAGTLLDNQLKGKKVADYDTDKGLERRLIEAQIGSTNRANTPEGRGKTPQFTSPAQGSLAAVFSKPNEMNEPQLDSNAVQDFFEWRARHPEIADGDMALSAYIATQRAEHQKNLEGARKGVKMREGRSVTPAAIRALKENPDKKDDFIKMFGRAAYEAAINSDFFKR